MSFCVVGGDGLIGSALADHLLALGAETYITSRRKLSPDRPRISLDLTADDPFCAVPPIKTAFICAALTGFKRCEDDPALAFRTNVRGVYLVTKRFVMMGTRVILLSSSAIQNKPETVYGGTSALGEMLVLRQGYHLTAALRFGPVTRDDRKTYPDGAYDPVTIDAVIDAVLGMAERGDAGLHHLFRAGSMSHAA